MANYTLVQDIYNTVCECLLEPYQSGAYPGLSLGVVTEQDFLDLFSIVIQDFVLRTALPWSIFTQQVNFNQPTYQQPNDLNEVKVCFVDGQYIDHSTQHDLDDWLYGWQTQTGTPTFWHQDGLPQKTMELALNPNYTGAAYAAGSRGVVNTNGTAVALSGGNVFNTTYWTGQPITISGVQYSIASVTDQNNLVLTTSAGAQTGAQYFVPMDPSLQPPYGIYGLFNGASPGQYTGTATISGTTLTYSSGSLFDLNWNNYSPPPTISLSGTSYPIQSVVSSTSLLLALPPGGSTWSWTVNVGTDGNLTMVGSTGLDSITFSLGQIIPVVPDDACFYLAYGILARLWSQDGENKDLQRSYYALARYNEGVSALSAISGELSTIG